MATEDRRIIRTRKKLKGAMLDLLKEKMFKDISITEIAKVAGCNRVTFYSHYDNSTQLLADIFKDYLEELAQYYRDSYKGKESFSLADPTPNIPIFEFVYNNQFVFSLMLMGEVIPGSQNIFCDTMGSISRKDLSLQAEIGFDIDILNSYETYAFLGLFIYWIKQGFQSTPQEMAERLALLHTTPLGEVKVVSDIST
ncbi:TetR/AcrR family transcriptional regulator [Lysinibacillus piscis]|uniref:TetR family transcriptional regulator n=1 Tax=Lysinibacillus piscis TaxID=2518931 RepID=A0ABQ5NPK2_9BACI|nr:TetR/AcrR family transcriptional regulator [Lysinibacillus sp. KH24]GLC90048.1 TetR family transcriptional regulator [Lysinibacillus sp. KH24]